MAAFGSMDVGEVLAHLKGLSDNLHKQATLGLADAAEYVLGEAVDLVPHEYGDLQNSGKTSVDADRLVAAVSFDTPYAVIQHEDMSFQHNKGRQAKYLEQPLNSSAKEVRELIRRRVAFQE